jgi:hypothetical protein
VQPKILCFLLFPHQYESAAGAAHSKRSLVNQKLFFIQWIFA